MASFGYAAVENGQLRNRIVPMPVITKVGKSKRCQGYKLENLRLEK